jgi:hypothetical protein
MDSRKRNRDDDDNYSYDMNKKFMNSAPNTSVLGKRNTYDTEPTNYEQVSKKTEINDIHPGRLRVASLRSDYYDKLFNKPNGGKKRKTHKRKTHRRKTHRKK